MEEVAVALGSCTSRRLGEETSPDPDSDSDSDTGEAAQGWIEERSELDSDPGDVFIFRKRKAKELKTIISSYPVSMTMFPGRSGFGIHLNFPGDPNSRFYSCPYLEVFSVQVSLADDIGDDVDDRGVYGRVEMDGEILFNRPDRDGYERVYPDEDGSGWCTLTPSCYKPIDGYIMLHSGSISLKDKDYDYERFPRKRLDGFTHGLFDWSSKYHFSNPYNDVIRFEFCGLGGSVRINFHLYDLAIRANVEVTLLSFKQGSEDRSAADICGTIKVFPEGYSSDHESLLFRRRMDSKDESVVHLTEKIPLLRSCVAVPLKRSLNVKADLLGRKERNLGTQIVCGAVKFPFPTTPETVHEVIGDSCYGKIEVTVHWIFEPSFYQRVQTR